MDNNNTQQNKIILDKIQNKKKIFEVFQGKFKLPPPLIIPPKEFTPSSKVVVFDLDETLGSFSDLYLLWTGIKHICPEFDDFNSLLDLYPEFLRYNILSVLQYLYKKKIENKCDKIYIYTNNQCLSREWVSRIVHYFNQKFISTSNILLFDQVISAFKIGNKNIELSRTTHEKTYNDLICCTMLPKDTEICFIDDTEFVKMKQDKVYYIHPKAYVHTLSVSEIIDRWIKSSGNSLQSGIKLIMSPTYWLNWFSLHKRNFVANTNDKDTNILITKKIMCSIREFFVLSTLYENKYYKLNNTRKVLCTQSLNDIRRPLVPKQFFTEEEPVHVETIVPLFDVPLEPVVPFVEVPLEPVVPLVEVPVEPVVPLVVVEPVIEVPIEPVVPFVEVHVETVVPMEEVPVVEVPVETVVPMEEVPVEVPVEEVPLEPIVPVEEVPVIEVPVETVPVQVETKKNKKKKAKK